MNQLSRVFLRIFCDRSWFAARCLFHDGSAEPPVAVASEILSVELEPEQMAWIGFGDKPSPKFGYSRNSTRPAASASSKPVPLGARAARPHSIFT